MWYGAVRAPGTLPWECVAVGSTACAVSNMLTALPLYGISYHLSHKACAADYHCVFPAPAPEQFAWAHMPFLFYFPQWTVLWVWIR